jgi:nucleotide-binding universal stress UspA family protein
MRAPETGGMSQSTPSRRNAREDPGPGGEVVAGLTSDGSLVKVARTAVDLAETLGARVRFVHVMVADRGVRSPATASGSAAFAAAMAALRQGRKRGATFESLCGPAALTLVERSHKAIALVVADDPDEGLESGSVAAYCLSHARCPVRVVPREA